jgi:hypothetical protein
MKILHFSLTPLAGSPIKICNALNRHTDISARLAVKNPDAYGTRTYEQDLVWDNNRDEIIELASKSDIIHLHNYLDLESRRFEPINFNDLVKKGIRVIRQFHTGLPKLAKIMQKSTTEILDNPLPSLVLAQFQERHYPKARIVPNIIPINSELYTPMKNKEKSTLNIFCAPTEIIGAWESRWDTKGHPETEKVLDLLEAKFNNVKKKIVYDTPHTECLQLRRQCHASVDELVTGSYHLSGLESLSQGLCTFGYIDARLRAVLLELTGAGSHPWINVPIEHFEDVATDLLNDPDRIISLGNVSRKWMETYWDEKILVQHYVKAYEDLLENPEIFRENRFDPDNKAVMWFVRDAADNLYRARKNKFTVSQKASPGIMRRVFNAAKDRIDKFR